MAQSARRYLWRLPPRTEELSAENYSTIREYCSTIVHVLTLLDTRDDRTWADEGNGLGEESLRTDQAILLTVHTGLLIHLYSKVVKSAQSQGLVDLSNQDDSPDLNTTSEGFAAVTEARCKAIQAILRFEEGGGHLDKDFSRHRSQMLVLLLGFCHVCATFIRHQLVPFGCVQAVTLSG